MPLSAISEEFIKIKNRGKRELQISRGRKNLAGIRQMGDSAMLKAMRCRGNAKDEKCRG